MKDFYRKIKKEERKKKKSTLDAISPQCVLRHREKDNLIGSNF